MKPAALFLGALLILTHYGYQRFAGVEAQWIYYAMRGVEGAALWAVVGLWAFVSKPTIWRLALLGVCAAGAVEEAETAVCGFTALHKISAPLMPAPLDGLCGALMGIPLAGVQVALFVTLFVSAIPWGRRDG